MRRLRSDNTEQASDYQSVDRDPREKTAFKRLLVAKVSRWHRNCELVTCIRQASVATSRGDKTIRSGGMSLELATTRGGQEYEFPSLPVHCHVESLPIHTQSDTPPSYVVAGFARMERTLPKKAQRCEISR